MFCSQCGTNIPDGLTACPGCGKPLNNMNYNQPIQPAKKRSNIGVIIGCVIGGIILLSLLGVLMFLVIGDSDGNDMNTFSDVVSQTASDADQESEPQFSWYAEPYFEADDMAVISSYKCDYIDTSYVAFYTNGNCGLVNSEGRIVCEPVYSTPGYCPEYRGITFNQHFKVFDPETEVVLDHGGHGGGFSKMIYDLNGKQFLYIYGGDGPSEETVYDKTKSFVVYEAYKEAYEPIIDTTYYNYRETGRIGLYHNGELVVPFDYELATDISDGVVGMYDGSSWTYFAEDGTVILENVETNGDVHAWSKIVSSVNSEYQEVFTDRVYEFSCGCVPVKKDGKWGYMNKNADMIIDAQFDKALPAYNNRAWVCVDGLWGIIEIGKQ